MDGIYTEQDAADRYDIMGLCLDCARWTKFNISVGAFVCSNCGSVKYDRRNSRSIRSWLVTKDVKVKRATKKQSGA